MSASRSIRKSLPLTSSPSSDSMFFNYSPVVNLTSHPSNIRSPLVEDTDVRSSDFVWEAEYQDKMPVLKNSISQVPSIEKRQINFQFIDDMKATFDLKSLHSKKKRPTVKQVTTDNKASARKDRKGTVKVPDSNKKRRPRNAFILYRTVLQAKAEFKGKTQTELSRLIAACWQNEPPETRARFERAAELEKAFGYGATDVFNIRVGPAEREWDSDNTPNQPPQLDLKSDADDIGSAFIPEPQNDYSQPINYPMYIPPYSPPFDPPQQDPYQIHADFRMLGSAYTDNPVYAGTPCGQINLSPHQAMFPFNTFPMESTPSQTGPMSPQEYGRSSTNFYATPMEPSMSTMTTGESFALQTSPPDVSDIPADYPAYDNYHIDYSQNPGQADSHAGNGGFSAAVNNDGSFQSFTSGSNEMLSQTYQATAHPTLENASASDHGMFMQSQYPVNSQTALEGYLELGGQIFDENAECFPGHNIPHYQ